MTRLQAWIGAAAAIIFAGTSLPLAASETPNTSTNYAWPAGTVLTSVDFTTTVTDDPGHAANVFWSNQFDFESGGTAYTGMQTNGGKPRNFLFSVWTATEARPGSPGSHCEDFQENGAGKACGMHFDWQQGHAMRFRLAAEGDRWFGVTVSDLTAGTSFKIGSIRTASSRIATGNMSSWTEYFEWNFDTATCFNQPYARAVMALPVGNGGMVKASVDSTEASGDSRKPGACRSHVMVSPMNTIQANGLGNSFRGLVKTADGACLDGFGFAEPGAKAITFGCNGHDNQAWVLGANGALQLASNLCLDAGGGVAHAPVVLQPCRARAGQRWSFHGGQLLTAASTCLTAHAVEEQLTVEPCDGHPAQRLAIPLPRRTDAG